MRKRALIAGMLLATVIFFAIIGLGVKSSDSESVKNLQLLHVIIRHGARTPADTYPNDPYINETFYPVGWGQLTNKGKLDLYNVGKFLRRRYDKFLGAHYTPDIFYTQSTDVDRTKASMQMINAGLWPPEIEQKWGPLDWQPVPVHAEPLAQDSLLLVRRPCANYHLELDHVLQLPPIKKKFQENEKLFQELSDKTGKTVKNFDDVQDIYSTLKAEEGFNLTLPDWTKNYYPHRMTPPTIFSYVLNAYSDKLKRLKGGVLLKKLISDWSSKAEGKLSPAQRKAYLYGGHDSTITNLLSALGVWDPQIPDYGIMVLLELSQDRITRNFGVEIFLRNSTGEPHKLQIPGCGEFCPLDKLIELRSEVIPENWDEECKSDDPDYIPPPPRGP
ncbi:venom acid phosphatase Acph-1-like [Tribolium madens]|uniref:venom acid phosphatase Acph-1-like n=1 Tax=Tribolium madens TaxID=41895 RepID=UPI001CF74EE5|nr:venom acid phosphatase Acph-1-like [Tribolium madens]